MVMGNKQEIKDIANALPVSVGSLDSENGRIYGAL